jgi:SurA N-terminal domain
MRRFLQLVLFLALSAGVCAAQQVVDRIIATVNHDPILLSDWEVEMRYEAMLDQKPLPLTDEVARGALDRLIDQELVRQQIRSYRMVEPSAKDISTRMAELRKQLLTSDTDAGFRALLGRYGISEEELRDRVKTQLTILRFIDVRLRPSVHVERRSIEAYYNDTLLPETRKKGEQAAPLAEVAPQIEELLSQQRVDTLTNEWLKDLRQQAEIHVDAAAGAQPNASSKSPEQAIR